MNEALKMQISAFIDGELPENEAELLIRRLNQDVLMRQQVARYLAIGRYIRRDAEVPGMDGLRSRIASALGEDSVSAAPLDVRQKSRFLKPTLGFAVAASVAVLAVIGLRQSVLPEAADIATQTATANVDAVSITQPSVQSSGDDVVSEELRQMYRRHSASSSDFGANGIITRLVTLELQGSELVEVSLDRQQRAMSGTARSPDANSSEELQELPDLRMDGTSVDGETQAD